MGANASRPENLERREGKEREKGRSGFVEELNLQVHLGRAVAEDTYPGSAERGKGKGELIDEENHAKPSRR